MTNQRDDEEQQAQLPLDPPEDIEDIEDADVEAAPARTRLERRSRVSEPDYPFDSAPAPVVTDEGVYGTLPPRATSVARLRDYDRGRSAREQWTRVAAAVLALALGVWLVLYSASQVTGESVALPVIERTVEGMTGLQGLLVLHEAEIRAGTEDPAVIPGFSVPGVSLSRSEVTGGSVQDWHQALLERTARAVYQDGPAVLADGGEQSGQGAFSTAGGARLLMQTLSEGNHSLASMLLWPVGLVALLAAAAVLALGRAFSRFSAIGFALLVAAIPPVVAGVLGMGLVAFIGSDGSNLAQETNGLAGDLVRAPLRNGLTVALVGLAIALPARLVGAVFARSQPRAGSAGGTDERAYDARYETGYDEAYD